MVLAKTVRLNTSASNTVETWVWITVYRLWYLSFLIDQEVAWSVLGYNLFILLRSLVVSVARAVIISIQQQKVSRAFHKAIATLALPPHPKRIWGRKTRKSYVCSRGQFKYHVGVVLCISGEKSSFGGLFQGWSLD